MAVRRCARYGQNIACGGCQPDHQQGKQCHTENDGRKLQKWTQEAKNVAMIVARSVGMALFERSGALMRHDHVGGHGWCIGRVLARYRSDVKAGEAFQCAAWCFAQLILALKRQLAQKSDKHTKNQRPAQGTG